MNVLVCTIGQNWLVPAESLGLVNYRSYDFYSDHADKERIMKLREKYFSNEVDTVWMIGTDNTSAKEQVKDFRKFVRLAKYNVKVEFFSIKGVADITEHDHVSSYAELCYRIMLKARKEALEENGKVYVSIAGGRKTMSSDLQNASYIFGADAVIHVISKEDDKIRKFGLLKPEDFLNNRDRSFISNILPVVMGGYYLHNSIDFSALPPLEPKNIKSTELYDSVQDRIQRAGNQYRHLDTTDDNFRILYQYNTELINRLKSWKIGIDPGKREAELALLRGLPKTELHCHLGGCLLPEDLLELLQNQEYKTELKTIIEKSSLEERKKRALQNLLEFKGDAEALKNAIFGEYSDEQKYRNVGFEKYEKLGDIQGSTLLQTENILRFAIRRLVERAISEHVIHLEIRCSPVNYTKAGLQSDAVLSILCSELDKYKDKLSISLLIIASRHGKMSDIYRHIELVDQMRENDVFLRYFKGFDVAGNEKVRSPEKLRPAFLEIMEQCPNITIHAGETENAASIWQAIYHLNAERIGHGLTLVNDDNLRRKILDRKIGIEMCPSSNFQINSYHDNYFLENEMENSQIYPLKQYLNEGLRVSVNTDNPGISLTNATNELLKAARMTPDGLSLWDILKIIKNGCKTAFAGHNERKELIKKAENLIETWIKTEIERR